MAELNTKAQAEWLYRMVTDPPSRCALVTGMQPLPPRYEYAKGDLVEVVQPDGSADMYRVAKVTPMAGGFGATYDMEPAESVKEGGDVGDDPA